jgi:tRNA G18 (ribose-2'-O)-methylase SpoU
MPAMVVRTLDDLEDDLLSDYRSIADPALAARRGLFVAEGRLVVTRLLRESRFAARSALVTETARRALRDALDTRPDLPVYVVPPPVMNAIAGFNIHRGCLAIGVRPAPADWRTLAHGPRLVVLERVGDADNVGAIFRSAAAFGADAVLVGPGCADPLYRKAIRTSMGAALTVPFAPVREWPAALDEMRAAGRAVIGLTPNAGAQPLRHVRAAVAGRPIAIVVGHEGDGLTGDALAACEYHARIPMTGRVDSLNVATAAAVALYELTHA